MRFFFCLAITILLFSPLPCSAGIFDVFFDKILPSMEQQGYLDDNTIVKGLKEALATGTEKAVTEVARPDGYFGNPLIRILLPEKFKKAADLMGTIGYQKQVDEFVLSMNRAAERAAPSAGRFFGDAIRNMTVEDARGILSGGDTAATRFLEKQTRSQLFDAFRPIVAENMEKVGTVRSYKGLIGKYEALPLASLVGIPSLNLDSYVTNKALDGLFTMVGAEEKKIRTNPAARTTELLRKVFSGR